MVEGDDEKIGEAAPAEAPTAGEQLRLAIHKVVEACPGLLSYGGNAEQPEQGPVGTLVMEAIRRASERAAKLRGRIDEVKGISSETAVRYMELAAAAYLMSQQEPGSDERKLYDAGNQVGQYIVERWQARIARDLSKQQGGN